MDFVKKKLGFRKTKKKENQQQTTTTTSPRQSKENVSSQVDHVVKGGSG